MFAGNATITVRSLATGNRYTYKIVKSKSTEKYPPAWFVSVMTGADNESNYEPLGIVNSKLDAFRSYSRTRIKEAAPSYKAFAWLFAKFVGLNHMPQNIEVWHEGRCGRCGRKLTVPESIESGFGPECSGKIAA
jgi:hypothetical protein